MNSNFTFTGVGNAGMPRTHRVVAPTPIAAAAHIASAAWAAPAAPMERKRRAATAAAATGASVKRGTT